jgi:hypothetical protein
MAIKGGGLGLKIVGLRKNQKMEKNKIEQFSMHIVNEYVAGIVFCCVCAFFKKNV